MESPEDAPWCPECQAAQYRGEFGLETDEQRLLRHLAEFNEAVADAVAWLRADGGDVCNAYADEIERGEHLGSDDDRPL